MKKKKLAIITSHPIQYNAPLFQMLAARDNISSRIFYTWGKEVLNNKFDPGFGKVIQWDIPLLEGYEYEFLENKAADKGSHHFNGIINPNIIEEIDAYDPDAILVFGWAFKSHLRVLRHYNRKIPIIFRGDSTLLDKSTFLKKQIRLMFLKWVYKHIDYALFVGRNNYEYFRRVGLKDAQLLHAPHAIDNKRFTKEDEANTASALHLRETLGILPEQIVFLFAGKLEQKKDIQTLLLAFENSGLHLSSHLIIVGNGDLEPELKRVFGHLPSVHFMDFQNQSRMPWIYRIADVFVLPSKGPGETWGLAVNEAMACGLAVLVSDKAGGGPDLVEPGKNGYIFRSGDVNDLGVKMRTLADSGKAGLEKMGKTSKNKIADFSF